MNRSFATMLKLMAAGSLILLLVVGISPLSSVQAKIALQSSTSVIFYQDANYGGVASGAKVQGDYAVMPSDVPNDWMSSLKVPSGWIVDAYADGGFAGAVCTYTADTSWVGTACNDNMSSFKIRAAGPTVTTTRTPTVTTGPSATPTRTNTLVTSTNTATFPPTGTMTRTMTRTNTPIGSTATFTRTSTSTNTPIGATATFTRTPTRTNTPITPTATFTITKTMTPTGGQSAYPSGVAWAIPGTIQAENFDLGGETVAYHDLETTNQGAQYRTTDGVDIEVSTDTGGGYSVGWARTDEWMEYTVNVAAAGNYTLTERVASAVATGQFRVEFNGVDKTGVVPVPNTGGWQTWANLSQTVSLSAGVQVMRIYFTGNDSNVNYFSLSAASVVTATQTPTITNTPSGVNHQPNTPTITEPNVEGKVVNPGDVHMETAPFSDPDAGQTHACTDWEIWNAALTERVWFTSCIGGIEKVHTHLGDGVFQGSLAGRTDLLPNTNYIVRARHKDNSGAAATEWSAYVQRGILTSSVSVGNPNQLWSLPQAGYEVQVAATGFQLPVNIAFIPNPGTQPTSPLYYVTELYGTIKVVTRAGAVSDYVTGLLNFNPTGNFPGSGEQGVTGLVIDPATGDLFAGMLYEAAGGNHYPKVVRFHSTNAGMTAATQTVILDMAGETQGQSHQISNFSLGPDGKLYVHMGDGFDATKGQDLASFRGKILRMNLDGSAATDNPLYNAADGITARDYVYAYGFRNPFGGAWRASDNAHYEVENGPSVDRIAKVVSNRNYLYDGSDASMSNFALYNWNPARAPVNIVFIQSQTFSGSGFPASKLDHAFVSESGPTYTTGPQTLGKRIVEFVLDANGNRVSGPTTIIEYSGTGKASVVALTAGPDGLYFSDLYKDLNFVSPIDRGANIYRLKYIGSATGVTFYQDIDYGGTASTVIAKGDYAVLPGSVPNDWMSSLKIPAGWIVDTYSEGNFGGTLCTFTADTNWVGTACNDNMSSFKIH